MQAGEPIGHVGEAILDHHPALPAKVDTLTHVEIFIADGGRWGTRVDRQELARVRSEGELAGIGHGPKLLRAQERRRDGESGGVRRVEGVQHIPGIDRKDSVAGGLDPIDGSQPPVAPSPPQLPRVRFLERRHAVTAGSHVQPVAVGTDVQGGAAGAQRGQPDRCAGVRDVEYRHAGAAQGGIEAVTGRGQGTGRMPQADAGHEPQGGRYR